MKIHLRPFGPVSKILDLLLTPLMYLVSGTFSESPQRSHAWHIKRLTPEEVASVQDSESLYFARDSRDRKRFVFGFPLFHVPILGGWREYVVLKPVSKIDTWHVGWRLDRKTEISRIPLQGPVRLLLGSEDVSFFGIDSKSGEQIRLEEFGRGMVGKGGEFAQMPLL